MRILTYAGSTVALGLALSACNCHGPTAADVKQLYDTLLAPLPSAASTDPVAAIPADLAWIVASKDPAAWRQYAVQQPFVIELMKTPAFEELRLSRSWLAIESVRRQVARAATFGAVPEDADALWRGPTAVGATDLGGDSKLLLVKSISAAESTAVRFAATFASVKEGPEEDVGKAHLRSVDRGGKSVSFVVFQNLLIVGTDTELVKRAAALAQKEPLDKDEPGTRDRELGLLPAADAPGLHLRLRSQDDEILGMLGLDAVGVSSTLDPNEPFVVRRGNAGDVGTDVTKLLAYAPTSAFFALVDGAPPSASIFAAAKAKAAAAEVPADEERPETDGLAIGKLDVEQAIAAHLDPGLILMAGVREVPKDAATLGLVLGFRHHARAALEPEVTKLMKEVLGRDVQRRKLEELNDAALIYAAEDGPTAGITDGALVFALSADSARRAIAAGAGKAPSLRDKLKSDASGAVYLSPADASAWLSGWYQRTLGADAEVLNPTFNVLKTSASLWASLEKKKGDLVEGGVHAVH